MVVACIGFENRRRRYPRQSVEGRVQPHPLEQVPAAHGALRLANRARTLRAGAGCARTGEIGPTDLDAVDGDWLGRSGTG